MYYLKKKKNNWNEIKYNKVFISASCQGNISHFHLVYIVLLN